MAVSTSALSTPVYFGNFHALHFAGRRTPRPLSADAQSAIDAKTAQLRDDLEALARWDVREHRTPSIQQFDIPALVRNTQAFLLKQAQNPPHVPYPFMIGVTGKTASGKTTLTENWLRIFDEVGRRHGWHPGSHGPLAEEIKLDMFYRNFSKRRNRLGPDAFFAQTNLDSPRAQTMADAQAALADLKDGRAIRNPAYSFEDASRKDGVALKVPTPFVMVEGLFALHTPKMRNPLELKVFVDIDPKTQYQRWWDRAHARTPDASDKANQALFDQGMAMQGKYITPQKQFAELVINGAAPQYQSAEMLRRLTSLLMTTCYPQPELAPAVL